jgi:hypothetical protein
VDLSVTPFDPDTGDPYGQAGGVFDQDDGIQNITVTIYHIIEEEQKEIFALEGYRSNR